MRIWILSGTLDMIPSSTPPCVHVVMINTRFLRMQGMESVPEGMAAIIGSNPVDGPLDHGTRYRYRTIEGNRANSRPGHSRDSIHE